MQVSKINSSSFGLKITDRAMGFFENKYSHSPNKLLDVDRLESKYPDYIILDIDKQKNTNTFTCKLKDRGSKDYTESQFTEEQGIFEIENFIKSYLRIK